MTLLGYRRGSGLLLAALVVVLGGLLLAPARHDWYGSPLLTSARLLQETAYLAAACAALAAAAYVVRHRRGTAAMEHLSSRSAVQLWLWRTSVMTGWCTLGFLILTAGALLVAATAGGGSRWGLAYVATGLAAITVSVAFGTLIGALLPHIVTPLVVGVIVHVALMAGTQHLPDLARRLLFLYPPAPMWGEPSVTLLMWKLLWSLALLGLFATMATLLRRGAREPRTQKRRLVAAGGLAAAGVVGAAAIVGLSQTRWLYTQSSATAVTCHRGLTQVCVWEDHRPDLVKISRMADAGVQVVGHMPGSSTQFVESGIGHDGIGEPPAGTGILEVGRGRANLDAVAAQLAAQWEWSLYEACGKDPSTVDTRIQDYLYPIIRAAQQQPVADLSAKRERFIELKRC